MKSFKEFMSETPLLGMMSQHRDPLKFSLAATQAQRKKKIKITRKRGAASSRELAAAFHRYKNRKKQRKGK
jgi:hypothetical protein